MTDRPNVYAIHNRFSDGGQPPDQYVPLVTAEVRVYWPPNATDDEIHGTLADAVEDANQQIAVKRAEHRRRRDDEAEVRPGVPRPDSGGSGPAP